ncbi:MAG: S8 family peptidase [Leptospira sp.]|nr:S8 family peptidase [Leptospira sp.]
MDQSKKNLPIRIFYKREKDDRKTEGGGNSNNPKWLLGGEELKNRSNALRISLDQVSKKYISEQSDLPIVIDVSVNPKALAKSHRKDIETIFANSYNQAKILEIKSDNEVLFSLDNNDHLGLVSLRLNNLELNKKVISAIEEIKGYEPFIGIDSRDSSIKKVKLLKYKDIADNEFVESKLIEFCKSNEIKIIKKMYTKELNIFRLENVSESSFLKLIKLEGILSIESMPSIDLDFQSSGEEQDIDIKLPNADQNYPTVGLLDSGVSLNDFLKPWVIDSYSPYPNEDLNKQHGTFCAGIIAYREELFGTPDGKGSGCNIFDAAVYPDQERNKLSEDEFLDNIRDVISKYADRIKIWNMSMGKESTSHRRKFSDFAMALDEIQDTYNVIIVKSAGNCNNFDKKATESRISEPSESVRSLVVGSIAHTQGIYDISKAYHRSPFSRIGPGPGYITKPELVDFGGNAYKNSKSNLVINGVKSFGLNGQIRSSVGTSYSAPRIACRLANLNHTLSNSFNDLLLKSLVIHTANCHPSINLDSTRKLYEYGFGMPGEVDDILYNDPHEITLIYQDELNKGQFLEILEFPFPDSLVDDQGFYYGQVIITAYTKPLLAVNQGMEYIQSDLSVKFGTYENLTARDTSKRNVINPIGREGGRNILVADCYSKKQKTIGKRETELVEQDFKFHPVKKFIVNLSEMTEGSKATLLSSKNNWYLRLDSLFRNYVEVKYAKTQSQLSLPFCLLITIRDPLKKIAVYDRVTQQLTERHFVHKAIEIENEIRVSV